MRSVHAELSVECWTFAMSVPLRVFATTCRCPAPPKVEAAPLSTDVAELPVVVSAVTKSRRRCPDRIGPFETTAA